METSAIQVDFKTKIPKPVSEVFDAIINPNKMSQYFISSASGPMVEGKTLTWVFEDVGASGQVIIKKIDENQRIVLEWSATGVPTDVTLIFNPSDANTTEIHIVESGWPLNNEGVKHALQQNRGWTDFVCCLKAYLLFNVDLRRGRKAQ